MAHAKHRLQFLERGVGVLFDVRLKFLRVEFTPGSPTGFGRQRPLSGGGQIPVNGTPRQDKPPGGLGFGTAARNEFHHPFPQVQRIGFHAPYLVSLCPNVNVKCYIIQGIRTQPVGALPELRARAMFGAHGLYAGDKFFGILDEGRLFFKTDAHPAHMNRK
jgi:hypothetical protein